MFYWVFFSSTENRFKKKTLAIDFSHSVILYNLNLFLPATLTTTSCHNPNINPFLPSVPEGVPCKTSPSTISAGCCNINYFISAVPTGIHCTTSPFTISARWRPRGYRGRRQAPTGNSASSKGNPKMIATTISEWERRWKIIPSSCVGRMLTGRPVGSLRIR